MAGRWKGVAALLVCVHCSLSFFLVLGGVLLGGAAVPTLLGVRLDMVLIPLAIVALFAGWLWWGKRAADAADAACALPDAPRQG